MLKAEWEKPDDVLNDPNHLKDLNHLNDGGGSKVLGSRVQGSEVVKC